MTGAQIPDQPVEGLRLRRCMNPECHTMVALCRGCDRGQRYGRPACRQQMRRQQVLAPAAGTRRQRLASRRIAVASKPIGGVNRKPA